MMKRRTFLTSTLASGFAAKTALADGFSDVGNTNLVLVVTDIDASTSIAQLEAFLTSVIAQSVPCVLALDPVRIGAGSVGPDHPLAQVLRRAWDSGQGAVEFAPMVPDLHDQRPYFQARSASLAISQLIEILGLSESVEAGRRITTLACKMRGDPKSMDGLRCTGIRTLMTLSDVTSAPVSAMQSKSGVLQMIGGSQIGFPSSRGGDRAAIRPRKLNIQILSARRFGAMTNADLGRETVRLCQDLRRKELHGDVVLSLPRDVLIRDGTTFERQVAVHVFSAAPDDLAGQAAVRTFMTELEKQALPFSFGPAPDSSASDSGQLAFWIDEDEHKELSAFWQSDLAAAKPGKGPGTCILLPEKRFGWRGYNDKGQLLLPIALQVNGTDSDSEILRAIGHNDDAILLIYPAAITSSAKRYNILRMLGTLHQDGISVILGLPAVVGRVLPPDGLLSIYRRTEANVPQLMPSNKSLSSEERELLLEDAKTAWRYFTELVSPKTGLCIATCQFGAKDSPQYEYVTMWDIASQINAMIAASDLELIGDADFKKKVARVLKHLKGKKIKGLLLPPESISTRTGRSTSNFNASDTCRLLGSLANLAKHRLGDSDALTAMVSAWDLKAMIVNGQMNSLQKGDLVPADNSHYAHYSSQCLALWGIAVRSPFDGFTDASSTDQKLRLLETLARLGPYGAEPGLLEMLDCGPKPPSIYAAHTLFSEQIETFKRDRQLVCPSETPIDRAPWFTYQGLQLDNQVQPWQVLSQGADGTDAVKEDQRDLAVSSKAAFLWAGRYEHPLAKRLLDYVREKNVSKAGFVSCIYNAQEQATTNYSDINTNGVILQAVADILRKEA